MFLQERGTLSRCAEPADLVGFFEFRGYRWHHWNGASAKISGERARDIRVATRVAESREIVQKRRYEEFGYVLFKD